MAPKSFIAILTVVNSICFEISTSFAKIYFCVSNDYRRVQGPDGKPDYDNVSDLEYLDMVTLKMLMI